MIVPAVLYGLIAYHSIWYPINLLGGAGVAGWSNPTLDEITHFRLSALITATIIHAVGSLLIGLLYGAMLPMMPRRPILLGGIIAPVLWTGVLHSALPLINPFLADRIDWGWFVVSQVTFGLVAGLGGGQARAHPHRAISALCRTHGIGNTGNDGRAPSGGRTEVTARLLSSSLMLVSCMTVLGCGQLPGQSQARTGGAASRSGGGLCYALQPELLRLPWRPGNERPVLSTGQSRISGTGR